MDRGSVLTLRASPPPIAIPVVPRRNELYIPSFLDFVLSKLFPPKLKKDFKRGEFYDTLEYYARTHRNSKNNPLRTSQAERSSKPGRPRLDSYLDHTRYCRACIDAGGPVYGISKLCIVGQELQRLASIGVGRNCRPKEEVKAY